MLLSRLNLVARQLRLELRLFRYLLLTQWLAKATTWK